jgi:hypothetical protein
VKGERVDTFLRDLRAGDVVYEAAACRTIEAIDALDPATGKVVVRFVDGARVAVVPGAWFEKVVGL